VEVTGDTSCLHLTRYSREILRFGVSRAIVVVLTSGCGGIRWDWVGDWLVGKEGSCGRFGLRGNGA
jgi:hypothetical protein